MHLPTRNNSNNNGINNINNNINSHGIKNNIIDNNNNSHGINSNNSRDDTGRRRSVSARRLLGTALALSLPLGLVGTDAARAESLAPTFSTSAGPVDANGNTLGVTLAASSNGTAWSLLSSDDRFSTFASIVRNAGLESLFDSSTRSTFLAPTNAAFADAGPDATAKLTDPDNRAAAASFVKGVVSSSVPSLLDYFRAVAGAVTPTVITSQTCTADTFVDSFGITYLTGTQTCVQSSNVVAPAPAVDHLVVLDGSSLHADVEEVDGTGTSGVRLSLGDGFVSSAISVSNGVVDAIDTVNLTHYAS